MSRLFSVRFYGRLSNLSCDSVQTVMEHSKLLWDCAGCYGTVSKLLWDSVQAVMEQDPDCFRMVSNIMSSVEAVIGYGSKCPGTNCNGTVMDSVYDVMGHCGSCSGTVPKLPSESVHLVMG